MASSLDNQINNLQSKIRTKQEEIEFFKDKIIVLDNDRNIPLDLIKKLDAKILTEIQNVNQKLEDVKTAYQSRITSGCKSDLFWRVVGITTASRTVGVTTTSTQNYRLRCVKLSPNPYPKISIGPTSYTAAQTSWSILTNYPLPPLDNGETLRYVSPSGIQTIQYNDLFAIQAKNLYGLKYYDAPYTKDLTDTFVTEFVGTVSAGSTVISVLSPYYSGVIDNAKVGQTIVCGKNTVFPTGFANIVAFGSTYGNLDYTVLKIPATATVGLSTIRYQIGTPVITNEGAGYSTSNPPTITVSEPNAQTAIGTAVVSAGGTIISISLSNAGTGYTVAPTITVGTAITSTAVAIGTTGAGGIIAGIQTVSVGLGYSVAPTLTFPNPPAIGVGIGTTATAIATIDSVGSINSITITNPGFGYTSSQSILISSPPAYTTATAIATTDFGSVNNIVITNPGSGYTSSNPPSVTFSDPLKITATIQPIVSTAGTISELIVTNSGAGYLNTPSIPSISIQTPLTDLLHTVITDIPASVDVKAPEDDGSLVPFTVLISDEELDQKVENLSLPFNATSFTPETIGIISTETLGSGVSIKYDNSGAPSSPQTWRPELKADAITDPSGNVLVAEVKEPAVGAGKIYYTLGLDFYPVKNPNDPNSRAQEGDEITVVEIPQSPINVYTYWSSTQSPVSISDYVKACPSCSGSITATLNAAISAANSAEAALSSGLSDLNYQIGASNAIRKDLMETNSSIWSYRILIGQLLSDIDTCRNQLSYLRDQTIRGIIS